MTRSVRVAASLMLLGLLAADAPAPDLTVTLGKQNTGAGLAVPSDGDGVNVPETIQGVPVRRTAADHGGYLYVVIDNPAYARGPRDLYVAVEIFDDTVCGLTVQYDKDSPRPTPATKYTPAEEAMILANTGKWRKGYFHLAALRLGHGQNGGADFRLCGNGVAVRSITVTPHKPEGYGQEQALDAEVLRHVEVKRPTGPATSSAGGMELTFGNDATRAEAALFKALSVTSVESYVDWAGVEPEEGRWDWDKWDKQVATLKEARLKWVPFLIAGPAYATPLWFQNGPHARACRCLEHGKDSKVQSICNPEMRTYVERFLRAFADRYRDAGVIESLLLGVSGTYGESIYAAGPEGGWTTRLTGDYHNHLGWWADDEFAVAAFRAALRQKYGDVGALNKAWGTSHESFDRVTPFLPDQAPSDRARADFVEWYQEAMTDWATFWVSTTRRLFPKTEIYLCTGGDGNPALGADFTAQAAALAPFGAGIRITNEGSDYAHNFTVTREVATATRCYRTFCGFEPSSGVDARGINARIYNAAASGARQLHDYKPNLLTNREAAQNFRANAKYLVPRRPRVEVALYLSRETWALDSGAIRRVYDLSRPLRDVVDHDYVTRRSVADGVLRDHRVLVLAESPVLEPAAARAIEQWVRRGGVLIAATRKGESLGDRLHDNGAWRNGLLAPALTCGTLLTPAIEGAPPAHWVLDIGREGDDPWLVGDWFGRESGGEWRDIPRAGKRWTGARAGVYLPVRPGADYTLRLAVHVPQLALAHDAGAVRINDRPVGQLRKSGTQVCEFHVPAAVLGDASVARLEMVVDTWKPSDQGGKDRRALGVALRQVEWVRAGAEQEAAAPTVLHSVVNKPKLERLTRPVGKGRTVFLPGLAADPAGIARVVAAVLGDPVDGKLDDRFATVTDDGVLWFDARQALITPGK